MYVHTKINLISLLKLEATSAFLTFLHLLYLCPTVRTQRLSVRSKISCINFFHPHLFGTEIGYKIGIPCKCACLYIYVYVSVL